MTPTAKVAWIWLLLVISKPTEQVSVLRVDHTSETNTFAGTPVGDPIESKAVGSIFRHHRTSEDPLYM